MINKIIKSFFRRASSLIVLGAVICPIATYADPFDAGDKSFCESGGGTYVNDPTGSTNYICQGKASDGTASTDNQSLIDMAAFLDLFLNFLYIIIRPLLAITGLALDNSLVYGEVFGMTGILRKFRTIMMQISFILMALAILRDIASGLWEQKDLSSIMAKKIKNRILAGIFIPMSRFLLSALVDLSTILIYQVGGIPLTILSNEDSLNARILDNHSVINLTDSLLSDTSKQGGYRFSTLYSCGSEAFAVCKFENDTITSESWKKYIADTKLKYPGYNISEEYCVLSPTSLIKTNGGNLNLGDKDQLKASVTAGMEHMNVAGVNCPQIKDIINNSKSMVGSLHAIYSALLNFTSLNTTVSGRSTEAEIILFLIKGIVGVLLIIPLIALAATSIARVGILRITIAFSPFIVLYKFFGGREGNSTIENTGKNISFNRGKGLIQFKPDLEGIINLIFQPVLVVLALGISIIFLSATNKILGPTAEKDGLLQAIGIEVDNTSDPKYQTFKINTNGERVYDVAIEKFSGEYATSIFFDYFTRILANMLGILIMRNLMFTALASGNLTEGIVKKVKDIGEDYIKTRPIFGGYSRNSINEVADDVTSAAVKKLTDDPTVDNAKELASYRKSRLPGSKAFSDHNAKFALKDPANATEVEAADALAKGITELGRDNKNFRYINTKDTPALAPIQKKLGLSGNLEDMVGDTNYWQKQGLSKLSNETFDTLYRALTDDKVAIGVVGTNKSTIAKLRSGIISGSEAVRSSYQRDGVIIGKDGVFSGYKRQSDGKTLSVMETQADANKNPIVKEVKAIPFSKTDGSKVDDVNSAFGDKEEFYKEARGDFDITSTTRDKAKENEVFYNTDSKRFEFKHTETAAEKKAREEAEKNKPH